MNPATVPTPSASPLPEQVGNPVPKTEKRFLLYGALIGLFVVALVGAAAFYLMFSAKPNNEAAVVPAPVVEEIASVPKTTEQVGEVNGAGDLDVIIVEFAEEDGGLEQDLTALEKDSSF